MNALDHELVRAPADEFRNLGLERAIVLTGTGRIFSAGVDLQRLLTSDSYYTRTFVAELDAVGQTIFEPPVPLASLEALRSTAGVQTAGLVLTGRTVEVSESSALSGAFVSAPHLGFVMPGSNDGAAG